MNKKQKRLLYRIIIVSILLLVLFFVKIDNLLNPILYMIAYLIIGFDILRKAIYGIIRGRLFDENFLMAVATFGAILLCVFSQSSNYTEAIAVMLFYQIGELFQSYAVRKSRNNISALMDIRPDYANIEQNGNIEKVNPDTVKVNDIIIVQPGEKVPLDGIIIDGHSSINVVALTGESVPVEVEKGNDVLSGSINLTGILKVSVTREYAESTVSKILNLVENASSRKSQSENFIAKFARIYTPIVCYLALCLAIIPPVIRIFCMHLPSEFDVWIYRALTFLVISCPCALVISIPLSFFAGIGGASKEGILIKGANYIETLSNAKYVVCDKTGTLTKGEFKVNDIHHNKIDRNKLIELAALAECATSHPTGKSIISEYNQIIDRTRVSDVKEISGNGVIAKVDNYEVAVGNDKLMKQLGVNYVDCHSSGTIVHVSIDNEYMGHIVISDVIKPNSVPAVKELIKIGIEKIIMLTGDKASVAESVANTIGIKEFYSDLLPEDKVNIVENLLKNKSDNKKLVFVGDGINDAPVLAIADVGISMGAIGSDAAIEASDIVIMDDNPVKIAKAIKISKKCISIVYQNIFIALGTKLICLILGAFGFANMWVAIFADVGVMIIAILNSIRALFVKKL